MLGASACSRVAPADLPRIIVQPEPGRSVFFVTADTHFGYEGLHASNQRQIAAMNNLPGTPFPKELGGRVASPVGVVVAGDLTESGSQNQWDQFLAHYGPNGRLRFPVFECSGNHDRLGPFHSPVLAGIEQRHNALLYGVAWGGLVVLCLDVYPKEANLVWLRRQLDRISPDQPVAMFFHYAIEGPYSDWWTEEEKEAFANTIAGHRIVAIFHGHAHESRHYVWRGYDVYNVGSPKHGWHSFAAVRVEPEHLSVASWDWDGETWQWWHRKPLRS